MGKRANIFILVTWLALTVAVIVPARAELFDVSPILTDGTAAGVPAGFPLWYQDFSDPAASATANPDYGIGPTPGGITLDLCPDLNVDAFCISDIAGDEFFYWDAGATIPIPAGGALPIGGSADLILATEGVSAAAPAVFNRTRIRIDTPVAGTYTVTHPYGVNVYNVVDAGIRGINDSLDQGCALGTVGCDFRLALNSQIGPYLFWDSGLPLQNVATGNFYVGDGATEHRVLGSPNGTNFFRVDGPPGSNLGGPGVNFIQTDLFVVSGRVFTGAGNTAPVAVADSAATLAATPVMIDVLANDTFTDVPIIPSSVATTAPVGGTAAMAVVDGQVKVSFTPTAGFTGLGGFNYTVTGFAGQVSAPVAVAVTVEDLKIAKAEFRPKLLKWRISGTSSDATDNTIGIQSGPSTVSTNLSGANEVPTPVSSAGSGTASMSATANSLSFNLAVTGLLNITSTHLHVGGPGENGPVIFNLGGANISNSSATLTAADLQLQPVAGINSFADAMNAILGGRSYIQVHTAANPAGELRGQLGPNRLVGSAVVQPNGSWSLDGKSKAFPDANRTISVRSSNGVEVIELPVKIK